MRSVGKAARRGLAAAMIASLAGCSTILHQQMVDCVPPAAARAVTVEPGGRASTTLSVLTYNIEALPWPARSRRSPQLKEIARQLRSMRGKGTAPDVILVQEAFTSRGAEIGPSAGYANYVHGPTGRQGRPATSEEADAALVQRRKRNKGEGLGRFLGSGLYILSEFPVVEVNRQPFRRRECAGFDCLSNKGVMHARIAVPGIPTPVDLFNTHLNSRGAAGVSHQRSLLAHRLQVNDISQFIDQHWDRRNPLIFGGDFNMRNAPERFEHFAERAPYRLVHQHCIEANSGCEVLASWDGDTPWMDTQDLQGFESGRAVTVEPVRVEAMFDEPWRGKPLSDHDGLLVVYKISWKAADGPVPLPPICR